MAQVGNILTEKGLEESEHRAVANAILQRDPSSAAALIRAHLERAAAIAIAKR
jgi:DNA-binding GntR family transcriptional regulator